MEIVFEPLHARHVDEIVRIEQASFPRPWTREMFERETTLLISHFYAAVAGGKVVGYGGYWHIADEAHIINLAVHPDHRSQGIGRRLLDFLIAKISGRDVAKVLLEVRRSNTTAQRLYASAGFKATGIRPDYYVTEDAVLMEKTMTGTTHP